tara:strand:- start:103 stop:327 length:225 start_codon:yes stop_codon:yes gene_type:complete
MNAFMEDKDKEEIEAIIDRVGMLCFIDTVIDICEEKADHIRTNWQAENLAKVWDRKAKVLNDARFNHKHWLGEK